jgi:hypothetical protein
MPIKIGGSAPKQTGSAPTNTGTADLSNLGGAAQTPPASQPATTQPPQTDQPTFAKPPQASFLMTGDKQQSEVQKVAAMQELRGKLRGGAREFYLNPGEFASLYFLDGKLVGDNVWDTPMVATHLIQIGGDYVRFVCMKHTEGTCIVCDSNEPMSQPSTSQLFTVINTTPYTVRNGPNKGKTLPARLQLFAATLKVREKLAYKAGQRGGSLAGQMWQFKRSSQQDPRTGDDVEWMQEVPMKAVLGKYPMLGTRRDDKGNWVDAPTQPLDYSQVYPVLTNAEVAQLRPDMAYAAGYTGVAPAQPMQPTPGFGGDPTAGIDDEVPF